MAGADVKRVKLWLPDLLDEMWVKVFEYLPVQDRSSIRLTCHRFYDISNCPSLLKSEQIVIPADFYVIPAISSLATSPRKVWNLKLKDVSLTDDSAVLSFFRSQGTNIRGLILDECHLVPDLLRFIILQCVNLQSFIIIERGLGIKNRCTSIDYHVLDDFNILRNDRIIR